MMRRLREGSIYDPKIWHFFENWILDSRIKAKFNVITFYIESRRVHPTGLFDFICQKIGLRNFKEENVMHVVTNKPDKIKGEDNSLLRRYRGIFTDKNHVQGVDFVEVHEVKDQEKLLEGVQRKLKKEGGK